MNRYHYNRILIVIFSIVIFSGCKYNKILKSNDPELKFTKAVEYYENEDCYKALPLFEELIGIVRGTQRAEEVYYYYAYSHFCVGDYYLANYYFKNFSKTYPTSKYAEECLFMAAMCSNNLSPKSSLDQTDTRAAMNEFQLFMDRYPESELKDSCNTMISNLRDKLEVKAFDIAQLYVSTEKYKAAVISLTDYLKEYPGSEFKEESMFLMVKANYLYAEGSIETKKLDRYEDTIESYLNFVANFPEGQNVKKAEGYYLESLKEKEKLLAKTK